MGVCKASCQVNFDTLSSLLFQLPTGKYDWNLSGTYDPDKPYQFVKRYAAVELGGPLRTASLTAISNYIKEHPGTLNDMVVTGRENDNPRILSTAHLFLEYSHHSSDVLQTLLIGGAGLVLPDFYSDTEIFPLYSMLLYKLEVSFQKFVDTTGLPVDFIAKGLTETPLQHLVNGPHLLTRTFYTAMNLIAMGANGMLNCGENTGCKTSRKIPILISLLYASKRLNETEKVLKYFPKDSKGMGFVINCYLSFGPDDDVEVVTIVKKTIADLLKSKKEYSGAKAELCNALLDRNEDPSDLLNP
jgi:hypothetical protein